MTKEELIEIVDAIQANWGTNSITLEKQHNVYKTWWRYVRQFTREEMMAVIDDAILADRWPPRIGWVVRQVIDRQRGVPAPPSEEDAYLEVMALVQAAAQGLPSGMETHPLIAQVLSEVKGVELTRKLWSERYGEAIVEYYRGG